MTDYWDSEIAATELSAEEKNGMQFYKNFSTAIEARRIEMAVEHLNTMEPSLDELVKVAALMAVEQPLSLSVVACAYADDLLKQMFKREIPQAVPGGRNELLNGFGPLSRLSQRIQIAFAFSWMSTNLLTELDLLRRIRNEISHKWDSELLRERLNELVESKQERLEEQLGNGEHFEAGFHERLSTTAKFRVRLVWLLGRVFYESQYFVPTTKLRLDPQVVLYSGKPPALLSKVASLCVTTTREIIRADAG